MRTEQPHVARAGHRRVRQRRRSIRFLVIFDREEPVDFAGIKSSEAEIEVQGLNFVQLQRQQILVPRRPIDRAVHHQSERLDLRWCPFIAQNHGNFGDAEFASGLQPEMAVDNFAVASHQAGNLESELANR
jgi:hypothetical protein